MVVIEVTVVILVFGRIWLRPATCVVDVLASHVHSRRMGDLCEALTADMVFLPNADHVAPVDILEHARQCLAVNIMPPHPSVSSLQSPKLRQRSASPRSPPRREALRL